MPPEDLLRRSVLLKQCGEPRSQELESGRLEDSQVKVGSVQWPIVPVGDILGKACVEIRASSNVKDVLVGPRQTQQFAAFQRCHDPLRLQGVEIAFSFFGEIIARHPGLPTAAAKRAGELSRCPGERPGPRIH